jgi:hypothetical protein
MTSPDGVSGLCVALGMQGEPCARPQDCRGAVCSGGVCGEDKLINAMFCANGPQ